MLCPLPCALCLCPAPTRPGKGQEKPHPRRADTSNPEQRFLPWLAIRALCVSPGMPGGKGPGMSATPEPRVIIPDGNPGPGAAASPRPVPKGHRRISRCLRKVMPVPNIPARGCQAEPSLPRDISTKAPLLGLVLSRAVRDKAVLAFLGNKS